MKTLVVFLLCAAVSLRAAAAPAEEAPVEKVEVKEEPAPQTDFHLNNKHNPEAKEELPALAPEVHSQLCLPGWEFFRGSCYYLNNNYNTWSDAVRFCANFEATLAAVHNLLAYNHFQHMAGRAGHTSAWIGGYHFEGTWRWQDGSSFDYKKFESTLDTSSYPCVAMNTQANRGWFNTRCSNRAPSICQIKVNC